MSYTNKYLILFALLFLAACSAEETEERRSLSDNDLIRISASIAGTPVATETRGTTGNAAADGEKTTFATNDEIGIYIVDYVGDTPEELLPRENHANNIRHYFDGSVWKMKDPTPEDTEQMYWPSSTKTAIGVCGYFPYNHLTVTPDTDMKQIPFNIKEDQQEKENYSYNDLLCSVNRMKKTERNSTDPALAMEFVHALSKIQINLRFNNEFKDLAGNSIVASHKLKLNNLYGTAAINLSTTDTETSPVALPLTSGAQIGVIPYKFTPIDDAQGKAYDASYKAILVPQTITKEMISVAVTTTTNETFHLVYQPTQDNGTPFILKSGTNYRFDITVGKNELNVTTTNSISWADGESGQQEEIIMSNVVFNELEWNRYNLGATSVNYEYNWDPSLGKFYQWGHDIGFPKSITASEVYTGPIVTSDIETYKNYFITNASGNDWLTSPSDNTFWVGENVQGPCPKGYRLPTAYELRGITGNINNDNNKTEVQIQTDEILTSDPTAKSIAHYIFDPTPGTTGSSVILYGLKKQGTPDAYLISWQRKNITANYISYLHLEYRKANMDASFEGKDLQKIKEKYFIGKAEAILEFPCAGGIDKSTGAYQHKKVDDLNTYGHYWSSTPGTTEGTAWGLSFEAKGPQVTEYPRAHGCSVRCVSTRKMK
ncbi:fimbrillin family protein [Bacteroides sp.]|uniref:fimbrillin family protein n=1 Tax=Bacteroides sp. TaxID=29523 RepID=UPI002627FB36|nr:fimbrillin family protein [Bacteroides sp.]MDD3038685.1 fimbrillin family protein [Bacteroides sp.]